MFGRRDPVGRLCKNDNHESTNIRRSRQALPARNKNIVMMVIIDYFRAREILFMAYGSILQAAFRGNDNFLRRASLRDIGL
jgi:hypothetical protein